MINTIRPVLLIDDQRVHQPAKLFGSIEYPLQVEPTIYAMANRLAASYQGGLWNLFVLTNDGFYMAPSSDTPYVIASPNGFEGNMSADALGITACLFAFSHLSFGEHALAETCAEHYHRLREYALSHSEVRAILAAID